ncbi:ABC transporter ATP-binding protein [Mycoplasma corogypsi]|uniref:ABC transporter ATP-binding protein n=1 Tax=Mycoplasma corogypsi TaxID=2106 RepID=UPI0038738838
MLVIIGSAIIFGTAVLFSFISVRIMIKITFGTMCKLRLKLYKHIQKLPIKYFDQNAKGDILSRFTNDVQTLRDFVNTSLVDLINSSFTIFVSVIIMFVLNWFLTLVMLVLISFIFVISYFLVKKSFAFRSNERKKLGELTGFSEEMLSNLRTIKLFNQEKDSEETFKKINQELNKADYKSSTYSHMMFPISFNLGGIAYAVMTLVGGYIAVKSNDPNATLFIFISLGTLISFTQFARSFNNLISNITYTSNSIVVALAGCSRIFQVLDTKVETDDGYIELTKGFFQDNKFIETQKHPDSKFYWKIPKDLDFEYKLVSGEIEFKNVSFSYDENTKVIENMSFSATKGQKVALVGKTGAGKTTITNLLCRFYQPTNGSIFYDGININDIKLTDLRKSLGYVLQQPTLFTDTLTNNIVYGESELNNELLSDVIEVSNLAMHVDKMTDKYETLLNDSGNNLSQGQKQLISIARTSYKNPPVLVLDEATSNIDIVTEKIIQDAMDKLIKNRTTFIIANRLSTIKNADLILVISDAKIAEQGTHEQLIKTQGQYYQLWQNIAQKS